MKSDKAKGKTNWEKLRAKRASAPAPSEEDRKNARNFWADADVVIPDGKTRMTVRFDTDIVEWFKSSGAKYQTRMNAVLRQFMTAQLQGMAAVDEEHANDGPQSGTGANEYMAALNELGRIRLQYGDQDGAASYFEESANCYRARAGLDNQTSSALSTKIEARWFARSKVMGFDGSQKIMMDVEEKVLL